MSQKPIPFLIFTLSISLFVLSAEAITWSKRTWTLEHNADPFVHNVATACLTTKSSMITSAGADITLQDDKACGDDIQTLSLKWDKDPDVQYFSVNTIRRDSRKMRMELKVHFKASKPDELTVLSKLHCPCLILKGARAKEAQAYLRDKFGAPKSGITPLKFQLHSTPESAPSTSPSP